MARFITLGLILASASTILAQGPIQSCTIVLTEAGLSGCTTYSGGTQSYTSFTDCAGCVLSTKTLGIGPVCPKITTVDSTATANVVSCSASATSTFTA